jgi:putative PIN family toxin of toxin-antitoxin system
VPVNALATQPVLCVLDTNIVLDLFVFGDPAATALREGLQSGTLQWIATTPMRDELARVLVYPKIVTRMQFYQRSAAEVLQHMDALVRWLDVAPKASVTCKDPDDQKFIDLAVAHQAHLLSKDHAVLCMQKRLLSLRVIALTAL